MIVSDLHIGSTVAMWPEGQPIQDGGTYIGNPVQRWLAEQWSTTLQEAAALERPTLVLLGDLIQGSHARDAQLVSSQPSVQAEAALAVLRPLVERCGRCYVVKGTEFHDGLLADAVELMARELGAVRNPQTSQYTWPNLLLDLGGSLIHMAHHIGATSVPASEASAPTRELITLLSEMHRQWPTDTPRLKMLIRAHRHRGVHVELPPDLHAMTVPGWQMATSFSMKVAPSMLPQIGYGVVEARGSQLLAWLRTYQLPRPAVEVVA